MGNTETKDQTDNTLDKKIRAAVGWANPNHRVRDVKALIAQETKKAEEPLKLLQDIIKRVRPLGEQDGDFVGFYVIGTGPIHKAIPLIDKYGLDRTPISSDPESLEQFVIWRDELTKKAEVRVLKKVHSKIKSNNNRKVWEKNEKVSAVTYKKTPVQIIEEELAELQAQGESK